MDRATPDSQTMRAIAALAGLDVRPERIDALAEAAVSTLNAINRLDELGLDDIEPATEFDARG